MITPERADLAPLFAATDPAEPFRQGQIVTFNPATGANSVLVGGATLVDLPILVGGDTVNFAPGDAVILLKYRSSWAILGRVVVPGNSELTAAAVDFSAGTASSFTNWTITTAFTTQSTATIPTPVWANSLLLYAISTVIVANSEVAGELVRVITDVNGSGGGETLHTVPGGGGYVTTFAPVARHLGAGGGYALTASTTLDVRVRSNGANLSGITTYLNYVATFRRV